MEKFQSLEKLDQLFGKIADALGVAIDQVQEHGMEYIMMYGKYCFAKQVMPTIGWAIIIGFVLWVIISMVMAECGVENSRIYVITGISSVGGVVVFRVFSILLPYLISPEMYSIEKALQLTQ